MTAPETRILFELGARLHKSAAEIEQLSTRELVAWVAFFTPTTPGAGANDDAVDVANLSRSQLRAMFHHG